MAPDLKSTTGKLLGFGALAGLLAISAVQDCSAAEDESRESATYSYVTLSLELASRLAWAALKDCRRRGYSVAVAVVDRGGNLQALLRDRFAGPHTPETAVRKAWTANSFRQNTGDLALFLKEGRIPAQVQHNPGALLVGGGRMVHKDGKLIGAVGVSGAPPGKSENDSIDGACAQAGIAAIEEALSFAD